MVTNAAYHIGYVTHAKVTKNAIKIQGNFVNTEKLGMLAIEEFVSR